MLKAIEEATGSVALSTYIFDNDPIGRKFADALRDAVLRGVEVRVLIDDAGARYSFPPIVGLLKREKVTVARFLSKSPLMRFMSLNLHNHRKIMVVDGRIGFTGGINIRQGNLVKQRPRHPVQDTHFRLEGPVVAQMLETFIDDWLFCTRESLRGDKWAPSQHSRGQVTARGISDGPDEDYDKARLTILGALACAQTSVRIVTPYFLPDQPMISALNLAAMRGVAIDIILPAENNLPYVQWATFALLWQVLGSKLNQLDRIRPENGPTSLAA